MIDSKIQNFPSVAIIVLTWNNFVDTNDCLDSLGKLDYPNYETILVDNASTDGSIIEIEKRFPSLVTIINDKNHGYAEGNNIGIRYALEKGFDYIFIVNNDTEFASDMLTKLINAAEEQEQIGAVGPMIYYYSSPKSIWSAGGEINWKKGYSINVGDDEEDVGQYSQTKNYDFLAGTAILMKRAAVERVGLFDTKYFMYWEETDWCSRARRMGFDLVFVPEAVMWHKVSREQRTTSPFVLYYMTRNRLLFFSKNILSLEKHWTLLRCNWGTVKNVFQLFRDGERKQAMAMIVGTFDYYLRSFGKTRYVSG